MVKVVEKIKAAEAKGRVLFSFEYFPPKTEDGLENLFDRMDRMVAHQPAFCDITWGAGGSTADLTLEISDKMQNVICVETMMHLTCTNMPVEKLDSALDTVKASGIQNILALRGDPPHGQDKFVTVSGGFSCALDLVKHIRKKYGDFFGITVAGYPEAHPEVILQDSGATEDGYAKDLAYLKEKCDAGAEVIVTQLFYDTDRYLKFVNDCRQIGITVPIVPGIMPIGNYPGFKRMTSFCKTKVPEEILAALEPIKDNKEAVKAYGIHLGTEMCKNILAHGGKALHLYTLNMEDSALGILQYRGLYRGDHKLTAEETLKRYAQSFGRIAQKATLCELQRGMNIRRDGGATAAVPRTALSMTIRRKTRNKKIVEEWAIPLKSVADVNERFSKYCSGELATIPWSEIDGLQPETSQISKKLSGINSKGFLTINSQPSANGEKSDTPGVGWGGPGGYVYQKAYLEVFVSPEKLEPLVKALESAPSHTYIAVNAKGETKSNIGPGDVNAVTWGVFPAREVLQPTVVDPVSFLVWKDEAFQAWTTEWASLYPEDDPSKKILAEISESYYLVSIVDNDYISGDLFKVFEGL